MKKWKLAAAVCMMAVMMTACQSGGGKTETTAAAAESAAPAGEESLAETAAEGEKETGPINAPNPMESAESLEQLNELGLHMALPEDAESHGFFVISSVIAEADFKKDGIEYCLRGSATAEDFSGIFEEFEEEELVSDLDKEGEACQVRTRTTVSGGHLADWEWSEGKYTLYTAGEVTTEDFQAFAVEMAGMTEPTGQE